MSIFCDEPIKLTFHFVNQFTDFTIDPAKVKWCVEYENQFPGKIETVEVGTGRELCLTPEQAKEIYTYAQQVQKAKTGNQSVVVTISAKFQREYADGTSRPGEADQQVIITNTTRAHDDAIRGGLPR